jgi:hypothetical protein
MHKGIVTVRNFNAIRNIDEIIESWAVKSGFTESSAYNRHVNINDIAYCFCLNENNSSVFLTINILDEKVRLEAWAVKRVGNKPKDAINELLVQLKQMPLQPCE